ncbi:MAG: molecular chaperone HtpG [Oscillospiraceae bacterium]|jgi:molecular chaperone HtpG|nr:molecular chaperone HtpG [Oscillospiraceae bacterium]
MKKQFKSESKRLLDLMVGSIYTHREIFLRELISNASDAIDKLCYLSLTDDKVGLERDDFKIEITADREARTLTVTDNGVGMTEQELEQNLGVIAKSGSLKFKREHADAPDDVDIIGQFGVGFYSAFMVASRVTVRTRAYGSDTAYQWVSEGSDGYTIEPCDKATVGSEVIMELKPDAEDDDFSEYLEEYTLHSLIKKYSDYIRWPILMEVTKSRRVDGEMDKDGKPAVKWEDYTETEVINSRVPIWKRAKSETTDEDCFEFYKQQFGDEVDPASVLRVNAEGAAVSYTAMLFIPTAAPYNYYTREFEAGLRLYASGVLIMENCAALLPEHFRFVRGVVDSPDLSLNISREMLQHDRQLKTIASNIEKKIKSELSRLLSSEPEKYAAFYDAFGLQLKYGTLADYGTHAEALRDLLLFRSSKAGKLVSLADYVASMPPDQKYIYYACGKDLQSLERLPQAEVLRERGYDVLLLTDEVDEFVTRSLEKYDEKEFRSVSADDLGLQTEDEVKSAQTAEAERRELLDFVKNELNGKVVAVTLSRNLKSAPVCLSTRGSVTLEMERYFNAQRNTDVPAGSVKAERVLELNASHPAFAALERALDGNRELAGKYARVLYAQAELAAGLMPEDVLGFISLTSELIV